MATEYLQQCKDKSEQIQNILTESGLPPGEIVEFKKSCQMVQVLTTKLLKSSKSAGVKEELLQTLSTTLVEYEQTFRQYHENGMLQRRISCNRLRRKLEQINATVNKTVRSIIAEIAESKSSKKKKKSSKRSSKKKDSKSKKKDSKSHKKKHSKKSDTKKEGEGATVEAEAEEEKPAKLASEAEGQPFWHRYFDDEFSVSWAQFKSAFEKINEGVSSEEMAKLKEVLDANDADEISLYKWKEFLKGFGPVDKIIANLISVTRMPGFQGFLSRQEAQLLLQQEIPGTFLIRFSNTKPGSFALALVKDQTTTMHILIVSDQPRGFYIDDEGEKIEFSSSLRELVKKCAFLRRPFTSTLASKPYFKGDADGKEVAEMLQGKPEGTFVVRFSSRPGCMVVCYVNEGAIRNSLVQKVAAGGRIGYAYADDLNQVFNSFPEVINFYSTVLLHPLK